MKKQISVYRVVRDRAYAKLVPVDRTAFNSERQRSWSFDGTWHDEEWVSLEMRASDPSLPAPDIWEISPSAYALEWNAWQKLESSPEETQEGRLNFLMFEGRKLAVIDSTHCVDCLDRARSKINKDSDKIANYVFDGSELAISLFKIPETRSTELYTLDGFDETQDFKTLVELNSLTGLKFKKLWSGESWMDA